PVKAAAGGYIVVAPGDGDDVVAAARIEHFVVTRRERHDRVVARASLKVRQAFEIGERSPGRRDEGVGRQVQRHIRQCERHVGRYGIVSEAAVGVVHASTQYHRIVARPGVDHVVTGAGIDRVVASGGRHNIVAVAGGDEVVTLAG